MYMHLVTLIRLFKGQKDMPTLGLWETINTLFPRNLQILFLIALSVTR